MRDARRPSRVAVFGVIMAAAILPVPLFLAGCSDDGDGGPGRLTLTATDFAFAVEGDLKAGANDIVMPNEGEFEHYALFFRIDEGHDVQELFEPLAAAEGGPLNIPEWAQWMGGPSILSPGETAEIRVNFEPGSYVFLCPLTDPDGTPHFESGMYGEISVEGGEQDAELPAADIEVTVEESADGERYTFAGLPETVAEGEAWVELQNGGSEPHELIVIRGSDDLTLDEALGILSGEVAPPAELEYAALGGPAPILPGDRQQILVDFRPGRYLFLCFVPTPEGVPHFALGMAGDVSVPP